MFLHTHNGAANAAPQFLHIYPVKAGSVYLFSRILCISSRSFCGRICRCFCLRCTYYRFLLVNVVGNDRQHNAFISRLLAPGIDIISHRYHSHSDKQDKCQTTKHSKCYVQSQRFTFFLFPNCNAGSRRRRYFASQFGGFICRQCFDVGCKLLFTDRRGNRGCR